LTFDNLEQLILQRKSNLWRKMCNNRYRTCTFWSKCK